MLIFIFNFEREEKIMPKNVKMIKSFQDIPANLLFDEPPYWFYALNE